jgi:hypothetical protein
MDFSLIALLGFCLFFAALLYYVIFVRREEPIGPWGKSGLVILIFLIVPVLIIALWYQAEAERRLEEIGFTPYPGFISSSGVATGSGENPVWVFSLDGDVDAVLDFYKSAENHKGWALVSESESLLMFEREGEALSMFVGAGSVAFSIRPGG